FSVVIAVGIGCSKKSPEESGGGNAGGSGGGDDATYTVTAPPPPKGGKEHVTQSPPRHTTHAFARKNRPAPQGHRHDPTRNGRRNGDREAGGRPDADADRPRVQDCREDRREGRAETAVVRREDGGGAGEPDGGNWVHLHCRRERGAAARPRRPPPRIPGRREAE